MAPGACGSRLANQCESTSGTSLGQTISLRAHSPVVKPPSLSIRFPSRQAPPGRQCALTHRRDISQSLPSPPGISAGCHLLTLLRVPQTYQRAKGQRGPALPVCRHAWLGLGAAGLVQVATPMRSIMSVQPAVIIWLHSTQDAGVFFYGLPGLNRATSIWILSQTDEDTIVEFPSLCFCYAVPVYESILALDSTEHTCWGECQAREHLLWSVAVGKLFHFDKMACGNTMA